jgi:hypothetical protein
MTAFGPKGRPPSTPLQVKECQEMIEAYHHLVREIEKARQWKLYRHNAIAIEASARERLYLPGLSWPRLHRWMQDEARVIKGELFQKYGLEV